MSIQVTCPSCLTRFQVNDKFAGKKGPCPKCKAEITIPDKSEQVVIHAPEDEGPKDRQGRSILKPLERSETKVTRLGIIAVAGAVLLAILAAVGLRFSGEVGVPIRILGILLLAPPLLFAGYTFARDQELEPYRGKELLIRLTIISAVCAGLWLIYAFVPGYLFEYDRAGEAPYWQFAVTLGVMVALGALAAVATFELEFGGGLVVAALYFLALTLLAVIAGITLAGLTPAGV